MAVNRGDAKFNDYIWEQTADTVSIIIDLKEIEYPLIKIEKDNVYLKCVAGKEKKLYEINFNLYEEVDIDHSKHLINNEVILFDLKKQREHYWPQLTKDQEDDINGSGVGFLEFCLKRPKIVKHVLENNEVVHTEEPTPSVQESENFLETSVDSTLTLASNSRYLVQIHNPAIYKIVAKDESIKLEDIKVVAKTSNKKKVNATVFAGNSPNTYGIKYIPKKVGTHILNVFVQKELTLVLLAEAYNINLIKIQKPEWCIALEPVEFTVDCYMAGEGELQILVEFSPLKLPLHCYIEKLDSGVYQATFIPNLPGEYFVTVKYNDKPVKARYGYTFLCEVEPSVDFSGKFPTEKIFPTGKLYSFNILEVDDEPFIIPLNQVKARVVGPSGEFFPKAEPLLFFMPDGFTVNFRLKEPGTYTIHTTVLGKPIGEYTHEIKVYNNFGYSRENATLFVPNSPDHTNKLVHLSKIPVNQIATFFVKWVNINAKKNRIILEIIITDPEGNQVPVLITSVGSIFVVEFTPKILGNHIITAKYNGQVVAGTPVKAKVVSDKKRRGSK